MIFSVPDEKGGYSYYEAPAPAPTRQFYRAPKGSPIKGMFPDAAWDVKVPRGAKNVGQGTEAKGYIATFGGASFPVGSGAAVTVLSFIGGLLLGKRLRR